jgi:hypothetical protein
MVTFLGGKRSLHGAMEMCGLVQTSDLTQPDPFGFQALLDFLISVDLHEIRRHSFPPTLFSLLNCSCKNADSTILLGFERQLLELQRLKRQKNRTGVCRPWLRYFGIRDVKAPETPCNVLGGSMFTPARKIQQPISGAQQITEHFTPAFASSRRSMCKTPLNDSEMFVAEIKLTIQDRKA